MTENQTDTTYNPDEYTVDEVNAYLAEHPDQTGAVLAAEAEGQGRKGIVEGPHATPTDAAGGDATEDDRRALTVTEAGDLAEGVPAGEKYEKGYEGFVPSRDGDNPVDLTLAGVTGQKDA